MKPRKHKIRTTAQIDKWSKRFEGQAFTTKFVDEVTELTADWSPIEKFRLLFVAMARLGGWWK